MFEKGVIYGGTFSKYRLTIFLTINIKESVCNRSPVSRCTTSVFYLKGNIDIGEEECSVMMKHYATQHADDDDSSFITEEDAHACEPVPGWEPTLTLERVTQIAALYCGPRYTLRCLKENTLSLWSDELREIYVDLLKAVELESKEE